MRYYKARKILIFWCLFIGIGAVAGACGMFYDLSGKFMGMDKLLPYFGVLPFADILFQNYLFSGISLLIVNGLTNITAAVFLLKKKKCGIILGTIFGITLMMWICIQFVIFPMNFMSTIYFIFGLLQFATGYACIVFYKQENYSFNKKDYKNIGKDKSTLVVYFSRLNRTAKAAYEYADKLGADIYELQTTEKTDGTLGFWWCGRFGMHKWPMNIKEVTVDIESYEKVVICTPIWVFSIAAPVRDFLMKYKGKIKNTDYVAVHFNPWLPSSVFADMDKLLGIKHDKAVSISARLGNLKTSKS